MKGGSTIAEVADSPEDLVKRAGEFEREGKLPEALELIDKALEIRPRYAEAVHTKGVIAYRQGRLADAVKFMEDSIEIEPQPKYLRNICEGYRIQGRYDEALEAGGRASKLDPNDPICHSNLSVLHYERGEPEKAVFHAERALALNTNQPSAHLGLAEALLIQSDFARGWEEYEWRYKLPGVPNPMPLENIPPWDGKPIENGSVLLVADQGYGDGIQFSRYIPWVKKRVGKVVVACSKELQPLIGKIPGVDVIFDAWAACPKVDAWETMSGLPRHHGTRLGAIPAAIPYLHPQPEARARWAARLDQLAPPGRPRIGLVWAGRPTHMNDRNRTITLSRLAAITELDQFNFISLQKGPATEQVGGYFGRAPLINLGPELDNFGDSAAVIEALDLLVCVDTSVGHVAGAIGKPVWVMLPYAPDWRWLRERTDTPWYPNMRLFRPPAPKDWDGVTAAVAAALRAGEWK
ncbi:MAG TPA: tetratricopeptide repeat protein [Caulobacteraceae bacterium]|nr:tetratricopeptide repeat protein [Caulobacteraceae bacterium]